MQSKRRVVLTGIGVVSPLGCGSENIWQKLLSGQCGIRNLPQNSESTDKFSNLPVSIAGIVPTGNNCTEPGLFNEENIFGRNMSKEMAKFSLYAMYASDIALAHARIGHEFNYKYDPNRSGVAIASGIGALNDIIEGSKTLDISYKKLSPYFVPKILINMASGHVSLRHQLRGPNHSVTTACAAGAHAIGDAYNWIRLGYADTMLAGGSESCICPLSIAGFARMRALSESKNPLVASRPFDKQRDGFVLGEGAAILVLEELTVAMARNAPIIAEIVGYGVSGDSFHITSPSIDGDGAYRAMKCAIEQANIQCSDIGYINAHATSTPVGDAIELRAIESLFGPSASYLHVSSTKGSTGHLLGAAGAIEAAFSALAVRDNKIPHTLNLKTPDDSVLTSFHHVYDNYLNKNLKYSLSNSFGFGGTNVSLIFKKYDSNDI